MGVVILRQCWFGCSLRIAAGHQHMLRKYVRTPREPRQRYEETRLRPRNITGYEGAFDHATIRRDEGSSAAVVERYDKGSLRHSTRPV